MATYDVLLIGAGQAAVPLARSLTNAGKKVLVAERQFLGGSCVNFGCTPTKAVVASARLAHMARRAGEFGIEIPSIQVNFPKVIQRALGMVVESRDGLARGLAECGADVLNGHAKFLSRDAHGFKMSVGDRQIEAAQVVINTGARSAIPTLEGLDGISFIHAGNWLAHDRLPQHIVFIGAGYIALEMAQFYRRMGATVTMIGRGERVAVNEDADISAAMLAILKDEGIDFRLNAKVIGVSRDGTGVRIDCESAGQRYSVSGSDLFIATGRKPNCDDLSLDAVGVLVDEKGFIKVDERLATSVDGVWAAGDVRGGPMFTHASWDDHRVLESQLFGDCSRTTAGRIIPSAIFTDPELGRVGMTETEARHQFGDAVRVAKFEMKHSGKATEIGETNGFIKLIAHRDDHRLLGAAVLSAEGAELVASLITLMNARARLDAVCRGIYIHPTLSEAIQSAALALKLI